MSETEVRFGVNGWQTEGDIGLGVMWYDWNGQNSVYIRLGLVFWVIEIGRVVKKVKNL